MSDQQPSRATPAAIERERDHLRDGLAGVTSVIDKYSDVVETDSSVRELRAIARSVAEDTEEMLQDARLLRLGIVGQVKAGKSSLLNLLLFDGQEVLPKAATPMTASLTHIVKSDRDEIEIEYYTPKDWEEIADHAREYKRAKKDGDTGIPEFVEAAAQLVEMAEERRLNVHDHLGKKVVHEVPMAQLNDQLRRFVGSDGDLTPLVKSVTIRSSQGVPDLDIVDTPGINDPIASRSRQADKMLSRCDAVLMLSYAGQFMDKPDVAFFKRRIPQEGIRHRVVLGSKFDSALVDVARDHRGLLDEAKEDTERRLTALAAEAVGSPDTPMTNDGVRAEIVLMSAMCATLAQRPAGSWATDERHAFDTLQRAYPDWLDQPEGEQGINEATRDNLTWIGNRSAVDDCLRGVRVNKDSIISEKMAAFLREKRAQALEELDELVGDLGERRGAVETADVKTIESQQKSLGALREELETAVSGMWIDLIEKQREMMDDLRDRVREDLKEARGDIKGAVETKMKTRRVTKGWGFVRWVTRGAAGYEDVPYEEKVLNQGGLESAIVEFAEDVEHEVDSVVDEMWGPAFAKEASKRLRGAVAEAVGDAWAGQIDLTATRAALREATMHIVGESRKSLRGARDSLSSGSLRGAMSFKYEGDSVKGGLAAARKVVKRAADQAIWFVESCKKQIDAVADRAKADLVPVTVAELERYRKRLKEEIERKEFILQRYGLALHELAQARRDVENVAGTDVD